MKKDYQDICIWIESYHKEANRLQEEDTYTVISGKEYVAKYPLIQVILYMCIQTIKMDKEDDPAQARSQIIALLPQRPPVDQEQQVCSRAPRQELLHHDINGLLKLEATRKKVTVKMPSANPIFQKMKTLSSIISPPRDCPLSKPGNL
jgi:hypothetical protein